MKLTGAAQEPPTCHTCAAALVVTARVLGVHVAAIAALLVQPVLPLVLVLVLVAMVPCNPARCRQLGCTLACVVQAATSAFTGSSAAVARGSQAARFHAHDGAPVPWLYCPWPEGS